MRIQLKTVCSFVMGIIFALAILKLTEDSDQSYVDANFGKNEDPEDESVIEASQVTRNIARKQQRDDNFARTTLTSISTKNSRKIHEVNLVPYQEAVLSHVDEDGVVFLASVDSSYVDMAINLYLTSFLHLNISNFLFVGSDGNACVSMSYYNKDIPCFTYFNEKSGNVASNYGSPSFRRKTHYKTKMILEALHAGATVVIVDLDIVFFQNPLPILNCTDCDIQIQDDTNEGNTGFYMARPTPASIKLHYEAFTISLNNTKISNQKAVDRTLESMSRKGMIKSKILSRRNFPCGKVYFEEKSVMFYGDGRCDSCVLLHNNWIVSKEAKIYRFKENRLWQVDVHGYYSDSNRKYISYDNPIDFGPNSTLMYEQEALKAALYIGNLLNRTVILPKFHCYGCNNKACKNTRSHCFLGAFYKISSFDDYFGGSYRENVFLDHPMVPQFVKRRQSRTLLIKSHVTENVDSLTNEDDVGAVFTPKNNIRGATPLEVKKWFKKNYATVTVLRFHNLYGAVDINADAKFAKRLSKAFIPADYRQYPRNFRKR